MQYRLAKNIQGDIREDQILLIDGDKITYIPNDPENGYWQEYQAWLAEDPNNQPEAAD